MGAYKEFIYDISVELGKDFIDVTQSDIDFHFMKIAQSIFSDSNSSLDKREEYKKFLPKVSISLLREGVYEVGGVLSQENSINGDKYFYYITK